MQKRDTEHTNLQRTREKHRTTKRERRRVLKKTDDLTQTLPQYSKRSCNQAASDSREEARSKRRGHRAIAAPGK
eukprot:jgi/Antlo1/2488/2585